MASPTLAANAYNNLARLADPTGPMKSTGEGPSFGELVAGAVLARL